MILLESLKNTYAMNVDLDVIIISEGPLVLLSWVKIIQLKCLYKSTVINHKVICPQKFIWRRK